MCSVYWVSGTDEDAIIEVVTQRSNDQRQEITKAYKSHYGRVISTISSFVSHSLSPTFS